MEQKAIEKRSVNPVAAEIFGKAGEEFCLRKAVVGDVEAIQKLISGFASSNIMLPRGPQYIYENLRDFVIVERVGGGQNDDAGEGAIAACGSLHVLWIDQAELRSISVHPNYQKHGLGTRIVRYLIDEARSLGLHKVYAFTLVEEFFSRMGFVRKQKDELPSKLWSECSQCPKYFICDEVGLVLDILM